MQTLSATRRRNNVGKSIKGVEIKKRDGNTLNGGTQQVQFGGEDCTTGVGHFSVTERMRAVLLVERALNDGSQPSSPRKGRKDVMTEKEKNQKIAVAYNAIETVRQDTDKDLWAFEWLSVLCRKRKRRQHAHRC